MNENVKKCTRKWVIARTYIREPVLDRAAWNLFWSFEYLDFILIFWTKYAFYNGNQFNIEGVCLYKQVEPVMC